VEAITITLDKVEVSGYPGMTILELAQESGVTIPTLCNDPHLAPSGACRICLVEEENSGALLASCVTPIRPGMVINTRSPRVIERRKVILQFMLASHPDSCLVCDKGNRCELRKLASEMGIGLLEFHRIPQHHVIQEVNPFIERDLSKCILCAKCIRADQELVVEGAIDYIERGFISKPATLNNMPLENSECTFCGTCIALCPTGALTEKEKTYHGTTTATVDTICPFCGCGCSISLEVKDNRLVRSKPAKESPVNYGTLCARGSYGYDFVHSPERLTSPMVREEGELREASWEEALTRAASEIKRIKEEYGPDSLAVLGSSKCTNEENYLLQRFARSVLGTNNIDNGSRLYNAASRVGLGSSVGFPCSTNSLKELEQSDMIMVIGANPTASAPAVGYAIKRAVRNKGTKLLLVDPRKTRLASSAYLWMKPRIGTDVALINGLAKVIIDEKSYDEEFVARKTDNFEEYAIDLRAYTAEYVEKMTGVPQEEIYLAARILAGNGHMSIVYGNGITQNSTGTNNVIALANLAMLTGNIGFSGGGIYALQRENNAQGACDMGSLPDFLPGYQSLDDSQARKSYGDRWGSEIPENAGLTALEMIEKAEAGTLKGLYIMGENPVLSFPNSSRVRNALSSLEFIAVADLFPTETAKLATVVLPAASFAEKDGTFTNFEGRAQQVRKAIEPPGESLPDWQIILRLAESLERPMPYSSTQGVRDEIEEMIPLYHHLDEFDRDDSDLDDLRGERLGARRFYKGLFPSGFGRFSPVEYIPPESTGGKQYPLTLLTGSVIHHFGSGTRSSRASRLKKFSPQAWVEINNKDAGKLGFSNGENARVVSPAGEVNAVIRTSEELPPGMLFMPISFPESPVNELFGVTTEGQTRTPSLKTCAVRLERTDSNGQDPENHQS